MIQILLTEIKLNKKGMSLSSVKIQFISEAELILVKALLFFSECLKLKIPDIQ